MRILAALFVTVALAAQAEPGAKAMFYDPGDLGLLRPPQPLRGLRPVRFTERFLHCGIHYWLETEQGMPVTDQAASAMSGRFTLHIRNNIGSGFLTVWEVQGDGRELTPRDGKWSGYRMSEEVYVVPGIFEFARDDSAKHVVIVWARSQTEVAHSAQDARARLTEMPKWMPIVRQTDDSTPGEIGTYVMNRRDAGVSAEIAFRAR